MKSFWRVTGFEECNTSSSLVRECMSQSIGRTVFLALDLFVEKNLEV